MNKTLIPNDRRTSIIAKPITEIFIQEWKIWLTGAVLSFFLSSIFLSGWPQGLTPNLSYPFSYDGDGLSHAWISQRAIEGWVNDNPRSGYPFGSSFLDYPSSDAANYLIIKMFGIFAGNFYAAVNLYILFSFSAVFIASFCTLCALGLTRLLSLSASLIYAFLPFHFQRIPHLFYMWYFVAPLFFYAGLYLYTQAMDRGAVITSNVRRIIFLISLIFLSSFGVYYALFGIIVIGSISLIILSKTGSLKNCVACYASVLAVIFGVLLNTAPNIYNTIVHGKNSEVAARSPSESEIYGLKLMQLILPRADHRFAPFSNVSSNYSSNFPLINENATSTLGLISSAGFFIVLISLFRSAAGAKLDPRISILSIITFVLFLFGTIGGFGAIFSSTISASIRGWNRISIFIAFGSLSVFFISLQASVYRYITLLNKKVFIAFISLIIAILGLYDQTVSVCTACAQQAKNAFEQDQDFVGQIESSLAPRSAIYQLPYMGFPEVPQKFRLHAYDLAAGFLHSKELRWSYAGMKGRDGDLFFRALSLEPISTQIEVIKRLGFAGIYIDRRGFEDHADSLISTLATQFDLHPSITRGDNEVIFYRLGNSSTRDLTGLDVKQILNIADYTVSNK